MSISPISLTYSAPQQATTSLRAQAFSDLANSLQSGNLQGAQQAYGILQQLQSNQASSSSGSTGTSANNPIATDFAALGQALSSGNLTQAQSDFQQLQTTLQSAQQTGSGSGTTGTEVHHRHHHGGEMEPGGGSAPAPVLVSPTLSGSSTGSDGSVIVGGSVNLLA
jgi:hypothetical protein